MTIENTTQATETTSASKKETIDQLIAKARAQLEAQKASQAAKGKLTERTPAAQLTVGANQKAAKRDDKKAAAEAAKKEREAKRAERKAVRDAKKAAKLAERSAKKSPDERAAEKAASRLPKLDAALAEMVKSIVDSTGAATASINAVVEHLKFHANVNGRVKARAVQLEVGDGVKIVGGNPKFVGRVGVVERVAKLRCHVLLPDHETAVYLFNSDVEKVDTDTIELPETGVQHDVGEEPETDEPEAPLAPDANILDGDDEDESEEEDSDDSEQLAELAGKFDQRKYDDRPAREKSWVLSFNQKERKMKSMKNRKNEDKFVPHTKAAAVTRAFAVNSDRQGPMISATLSASDWMKLVHIVTTVAEKEKGKNFLAKITDTESLLANLNEAVCEGMLKPHSDAIMTFARELADIMRHEEEHKLVCESSEDSPRAKKSSWKKLRDDSTRAQRTKWCLNSEDELTNRSSLRKLSSCQRQNKFC